MSNEQDDAQIPALAEQAFVKARLRALQSGLVVREVVNGKIVDTAPDGTQAFVKKLPFMRVVVEPGSRVKIPPIRETKVSKVSF